MNHSRTNTRTNEALIDLEGIPETVPDGAALCIAKPAPLTEYALPLHITNQYADGEDCRIIITSSITAEETIRQEQQVVATADRRLGIIDTTADEHLEALYQENPIISIPRSGDLTQVTLALWDLEESFSKTYPKTHVILRSLTPILNDSSIEGVRNVLETVIEHQRSRSCLTVFSVEYTEHSEPTMAALEILVDGVVWVEQTANDEHQLDYHRTRNIDW
ncbi:DUF7504 family protein [Haloterrigena salina]|uniref:DUF7504 family protein n=1 Tax=Haloterrigena salina TaxID=504937 RepID=UPI001267C23E|nr:hypothetical protein [Haloterrigena salina]